MAPRRTRGNVALLAWRLKGLATRTRERVHAQLHAVPDVITLDDVRRRLELMLFALHGRHVPIHESPTPAHTLHDRIVRRFTPRHLRTRPSAWTDGDQVLLPSQLAHARGDRAGLAHYRLLALVQAERIVRGTAAVMPALSTPLERDLFLLRESMAIEARLVRDVGSVAAPLADARRAALLARPPADALNATEREVERFVRSALEARDAAQHAALARSTPADSLAWARTTGASLRGAYRGIAPVPHWGDVTPRTLTADALAPTERGESRRDDAYEFEGRTTEEGGDGQETDQADVTREGDTIEDARGAVTQTDDASSASNVARAPDTATHHPGDEVTQPTDDADPGVRYPEWDDTERRYRRDWVTVRERVADEAEGTWAADTLKQHAPMVRRIRERFEPLRAQRLRLNQQRDGEELDLQACIQAIVDARTGHTPSDRLYTSVRPARRAMTICLLVDVSGSTESPLPNGQRIVDVERQATLFASEAFDVLGDPYALLTFSSRGAHDVRLTTIKDFGERNGTTVRQRIAGIEPGDNTRLGAAVRHASARLAQQPVGRRLLLILSDGRPNDYDGYYEASGAEDSRQAINEARAQGVFPYCITIDREDGPEYLPRIFGASGYTVLREPEQLPVALVRVVRGLLQR